MTTESATGHAKNARNKLQAMIRAKRKGGDIDEESLTYCLDEIKTALDEL